MKTIRTLLAEYPQETHFILIEVGTDENLEGPTRYMIPADLTFAGGTPFSVTGWDAISGKPCSATRGETEFFKLCEIHRHQMTTLVSMMDTMDGLMAQNVKEQGKLN